MHNTQSSLLLQLMQGLNGGMLDSPEPPIPLDPPFDILFKLRPMLSPKEQKIVDLMIKFQEIRVLIDEIHSMPDNIAAV